MPFERLHRHRLHHLRVELLLAEGRFAECPGTGSCLRDYLFIYLPSEIPSDTLLHCAPLDHPTPHPT